MRFRNEFLTDKTSAVNLAFMLGEKVIAIAGASAILKRLAQSVQLVEIPAFEEILAGSRILNRIFVDQKDIANQRLCALFVEKVQ